MQEKSFKRVIFFFNILVQKFDLPCFHQLVTSFHGNVNGISIPHFRFSAAPCQLRAVNAIWLTARIQNSSILKWQRERKRKCLPSHFAFLPLKRTQFHDCLSSWLTVIRHIRCLVVPLVTDPFKSLFYPSRSSLPLGDLTGLWFPSWLSTCCSSDGYWTGKVVKMLEAHSSVFSVICDLKGTKIICWYKECVCGGGGGTNCKILTHERHVS